MKKLNVLCFVVIEVSCGEYGNNIKKLTNAIQNGKLDIREGYPNLEKGRLNNSNINLKELVPLTETKDKNDINNLEEKFQDKKVNENGNGGIISAYNNDISKQSK